MRWLSARDLEAPGLRLFCLPHAGSGAAGFYRWKRLLPGSIAVCPVLLPGREARLAEPARTDVMTLVRELHEEAGEHLDRPYAVFGHSMGALLAYEWVRHIAAEGLPGPVCFFASGRNGPQMVSGHTGLHRMEPEAFVRELKRRYGGEPEAMLGDPELRELFLPIVRSDLQVLESYAWLPGLPLACDVRALAGEDDHSVSDGGMERWEETTAGRFAGRRFAGDHFYHFGAGQTELLRFLSETLETHSSAAPSSSPAAG